MTETCIPMTGLSVTIRGRTTIWQNPRTAVQSCLSGILRLCAVWAWADDAAATDLIAEGQRWHGCGRGGGVDRSVAQERTQPAGLLLPARAQGQDHVGVDLQAGAPRGHR